jgi:hypothetical protein
MVSTMKANLNELDAMLKDLSKSSFGGGTNDYYYSDLESTYSIDSGVPPSRPPPPKDYSPVRSMRSRYKLVY